MWIKTEKNMLNLEHIVQFAYTFDKIGIHEEKITLACFTESNYRHDIITIPKELKSHLWEWLWTSIREDTDIDMAQYSKTWCYGVKNETGTNGKTTSDQ